MHYHVFIEHYTGKGNEKTNGFFGNLTPKRVEVNFTEPYNSGESFDWFEITIDRNMVTCIYVFCSEQSITEILLPNGKRAVKSDPSFTANCFLRGEALGVRDCTADFVKAANDSAQYTPQYKPKEKKKSIWVSRPRQDTRIY